MCVFVNDFNWASDDILHLTFVSVSTALSFVHTIHHVTYICKATWHTYIRTYVHTLVMRAVWGAICSCWQWRHAGQPYYVCWNILFNRGSKTCVSRCYQVHCVSVLVGVLVCWAVVWSFMKSSVLVIMASVHLFGGKWQGFDSSRCPINFVHRGANSYTESFNDLCVWLSMCLCSFWCGSGVNMEEW